MIAADTSAWIDFSKGAESASARKLEACLEAGTLVLPEPVLFELLSAPGLTRDAEANIVLLPRLDFLPGLWERAGNLRRNLLAKNLKARAMDCLIAQTCIEHDVPLVASDLDYRHFVRHGLKLV